MAPKRILVVADSVPAEAEAGAASWRAFEMSLRQHHSGLHAFAYRILGNRQDAEDALQAAYLKSFRAAKARGRSFELNAPWLYRVVYRCCIDKLREVKRNRHDFLGPDAEDTCAQQASSLLAALSEAVLELPLQARAVVLLVDVHGLSYEEAAAVLEVPRGTIASRLNHARSALREALSEFAPKGDSQP
jgi:RNA polymerase sigma-70 factor (ECF subfamily)